MGEICGAKTRAGTPCQRAPAKGRNRCRLHGGATPRGVDSPHYRHGLRTKDLREVGAVIARDVARMRREVAAGRHYFSMAALEDIHTRLALLEVAVFGQARGWSEVTPHPDDASIAAALYPREWPTKAGINEAWRAGLDAKYPEDALGDGRDPMNAGTAPTPDDGGGGA